MADTPAVPPRHQLIVRVADKFQGSDSTSSYHLREGPLTPEALLEGKARDTRQSSEEGWIRYSPSGARFAVLTNASVELYDSSSPASPVIVLPTRAVELDWSPLETFVVTWGGPTQEGSLVIWSRTSGESVRKLHLKDQDPWPVLQWTRDEEVVAHLTTNQVAIYSGKDCCTKLGVVYHKGLHHFRVSPAGPPYALATFVPEKKGDAASVGIFTLGVCDAKKPFAVDTATVSKSFFNADSCKILWSPLGHAVLIKAHQEMTENSYDGKSCLYFLALDGNACTVPFGSVTGHVHDAQWSPDGKDFLAIQGSQPAQILLFNGQKCTAVQEFGRASRNTVIWSPHGRFVCIGGFGNLAGEMDFWERKGCKLLGSCVDQDRARSFEWTPCGRHFVTSVLWPKRRVDNGLKVWTYYGELVHHEPVERLTQVAIRPGVYPNLPATPTRTFRTLQKKNEEAKPKAYVPPALRGQNAAGATAALMKREVSAPRKLATVADPEEEAAAKAKKKEKEKARKERKKLEEQKAVEEARVEAEKQAEGPKSDPKAAVDMTDESEVSKRLKALKKKLAQTDKLQELAGSGQELDESQQAKLASRVSLEAEMQLLNTALTSLSAK